MRDTHRHNLIRIIVAIVMCLVIVSIPLTVKIAVDHMTELDGSITPPSGDVGGPESESTPPSGETGESEVETPHDTGVPEDTDKRPETVTFCIEIGCHRLFGDAGKPYIKDVEKRLGEELFEALRGGNMVSIEEMTLPYGSTVMDATKAILKAHGIGIAEHGGYISAIGGLAEKMAGGMSGWVYVIDGKQVMAGAASMPIREGITISWIYLVG